MISRQIRCYKAKLKAEAVPAALAERKPLAKLAARHQLAPVQSSCWKL